MVNVRLDHDNGLIYLSPNYSLSVAFPLITIFWGVVALAGLFIPCFFWKYKHRLTVQVAVVITAICCYLFWLFAYLTQFNPLIGPTMDDKVAAHIRRVWAMSARPDGKGLDPDLQKECFPVY